MLTVKTFMNVARYQRQMTGSQKNSSGVLVRKIKVQEGNGNWHYNLEVMPQELANGIKNIIIGLQQAKAIKK